MPIPIYSRQPRDDELFVMSVFEQHANHCSRCVDALYTHRQGLTLCAKGHARAADVAQYVYNKDGLPYSLVDRSAQQRVRLELPAGFESLRSFLSAFEEGLKLLRVVKRERRPSSNNTPAAAAAAAAAAVSPRVPERRRKEQKPVVVEQAPRQRSSRHHRRTFSNDSSDYDVDNRRYASYDDPFYVEPEMYAPSHRQPVFYKVIEPKSPTRPVVFYRR